ncbi:MAG: hypothetical protein H3C54_07595, partial [Taibaiella sp.]|nr:hypothetical protein [Taibaiella sp.]
LVFDGHVFQLTDSDTDEFSLTEIDYGKIRYRHKYKILANYSYLSDAIQAFGENYIVEILTKRRFENYLIDLEKDIRNIDFTNKDIEKWGEAWPTL